MEKPEQTQVGKRVPSPKSKAQERFEALYRKMEDIEASLGTLSNGQVQSLHLLHILQKGQTKEMALEQKEIDAIEQLKKTAEDLVTEAKSHNEELQKQIDAETATISDLSAKLGADDQAVKDLSAQRDALQQAVDAHATDVADALGSLGKELEDFAHPAPAPQPPAPPSPD